MAGQKRFRINLGQGGDFADKVNRGSDTDRDDLSRRLFEIARQPLCSQRSGLGVQNDIEVGLAKARDIVRPSVEGCDHVDVDAHRDEQTRDFADIVPVPKA